MVRNISKNYNRTVKCKHFIFLDVPVKLLNNQYETNVWRKSMSTGLLLNFNAMRIKIWKSGSIMCFLHRSKRICSNYELYLEEVQKLLLIFNNNGYSNKYIDNTLKKL